MKNNKKSPDVGPVFLQESSKARCGGRYFREKVGKACVVPAIEKAHAAGTESVFWGKRHGFGKECFFISESMGREQRADALMRPRQGRVAGTKKGIKKCSRCRRICVAALRARFPLQFSLEVFDFSGGGGESRTPVRERSAQGLYRCSLRMDFRLRTGPQTGVRQLSRRNSSRTPRKEQTCASPMH